MAEIRICLLLAIACLLSGIYSDAPCQPRPVIISTQNNGVLFRPGNFEVYKCSGHDGVKNQRLYRCIKNESKILNYDIVNVNAFTGISEQFEVENHTSCEMKCVCECPAGVTPAIPECGQGETWDVDVCQCRLTLKRQDCKKDTEGSTEGVSITVFIVSLVIEFVAVLVIVFIIIDVCKYRKHSKGVLFKTRQYVRHLSVNAGEGFRITTLKRDREATGSVSFLYDVNNGNIPNGKAAVV